MAGSNTGPWRVDRLTHFGQRLLNETAAPEGRPSVIAVDGRSSGGKTALAYRLATVIAGAVVVHTDDIAWWHARFDWAGLLIAGGSSRFTWARKSASGRPRGSNAGAAAPSRCPPTRRC